MSNTTYALIATSLGDIKIKLYDETPKHKENFIKLVNEGFYEDLLFHRVIKNFMIQGGDPNSRNAPANKSLGAGDAGYTVEAEILYPQFFHKKGALAAARLGDAQNPEKRSSSCQFYIVTGNTYNDNQLSQLEKQMGQRREQEIFQSLAMEHRSEIMAMRKAKDQQGLFNLQEALIKQTGEKIAEQGATCLTEEQREAYKTLGGSPHLDGDYTVFGEVVEGLDVVDKIQAVATGSADRPKEDITMKITLL